MSSLLSRISNAYSALLGQKISEVSQEALEAEKTEELTALELYKLSQCPPLKRAIEIRATLAASFISIHSENPLAVNKILSVLSPSSGMAKLKQIIFQSSQLADTFKMGVVELHLNDKMQPTCSIMNGKSLDFERDGTGKIIYSGINPKYILQEMDFQKRNKIPFENCSLLRYNRCGDEPFGTSLVECVAPQAQGYLDTLSGFSYAIKRLGFPIYDFSIGDAEHEVTPELINDVRKEVRNFAGKKEYIHEHFIKPSVTESKTISQTVDFDTPFIRAISMASGVPEFLITGETKQLSLASSRIMAEILPKILLPSMQSSIEVFVEDLFQKISNFSGIEANINISFEPIFTTDATSAAQRAQILATIPNLCSREELRKIAGLEQEQ